MSLSCFHIFGLCIKRGARMEPAGPANRFESAACGGFPQGARTSPPTFSQFAKTFQIVDVLGQLPLETAGIRAGRAARGRSSGFRLGEAPLNSTFISKGIR